MGIGKTSGCRADADRRNRQGHHQELLGVLEPEDLAVTWRDSLQELIPRKKKVGKQGGNMRSCEHE